MWLKTTSSGLSVKLSSADTNRPAGSDCSGNHTRYRSNRAPRLSVSLSITQLSVTKTLVVASALQLSALFASRTNAGVVEATIATRTVARTRCIESSIAEGRLGLPTGSRASREAPTNRT